MPLTGLDVLLSLGKEANSSVTHPFHHALNNMKRFVRRLSSVSIEQQPRNSSTSSLSLKGRGRSGRRPFHNRGNSEVYNPYREIYRSDQDYIDHVFFYLGYSHIEEPKSGKEIHAIVRTVCDTMTVHKAVRLHLEEGMLTVYEQDGEKLLVSPLRSVAHCDVSKGSSECFVVTFKSGHYAKQCHVFQAKANKEVSQ